jgi:hypothetical protein
VKPSKWKKPVWKWVRKRLSTSKFLTNFKRN